MKLQQGDVIIKKVDSIPENATRLKHLVLAEGEVTGHAHRIVSGKAELLTSAGIMYLIVNSKTAELEHEEHGNIVIPKGDYIVTGVREWDYDKEEAERVRD